MKIAELAKTAIENYIKDGKVIKPKKVDGYFLKNKSGVFVTIKNKDNSLRGCIGTYLPTKKNIAEETIANAIAAATRDYRFPPIKIEDLPNLKYEVSLLSEPKIVKDIKELNPKKYGIIIISETGKSALLLPNLKGVKSIEGQLYITSQKGNIDLSKEKISIYKFETKTYES